MKIYIDCTNGVSGDMLLNALKGLGEVRDVSGEVSCSYEQHMSKKKHGHAQVHGDDGSSARICKHSNEASDSMCEGVTCKKHASAGKHHVHTASHEDIKCIIDSANLEPAVKKTAKEIYKTIAAAEAKVHGADVDTVHFHEVGRKTAVCNMAGIAQAIADLKVGEIYCSDICDGTGKIECSHGLIPVPVPAVRAMMESCDYNFVTDENASEMVTPSGLGALIGIGAKPMAQETFQKEISKDVLGKSIWRGTRNTGNEGLKIYLKDE